MDTTRPTADQYAYLPIVCLVTYNCGHYTQRSTGRTNRRLVCVPDEYFFPIDEVDARNEPCGLRSCSDMNRDRLRTALRPMINHAFDLLTKMESQYQDMGRRFFLLRQPAILYADEHPTGDLVATMKMAFESRPSSDENPAFSFMQKMLMEVEAGLLETRQVLCQDPSTGLLALNNCRRLLCDLVREIMTVDRALLWLHEIQRILEDNRQVADETNAAEVDHVRKAMNWVFTLPDAHQAVVKRTMRSGAVFRTMFQPDRFLRPDEVPPVYPLHEVASSYEFHTDVIWTGPGPLLAQLPRDIEMLMPAYHPYDPLPASPRLDPDFTAVPLSLIENQANTLDSTVEGDIGGQSSSPHVHGTTSQDHSSTRSPEIVQGEDVTAQDGQFHYPETFRPVPATFAEAESQGELFLSASARASDTQDRPPTQRPGQTSLQENYRSSSNFGRVLSSGYDFSTTMQVPSTASPSVIPDEMNIARTSSPAIANVDNPSGIWVITADEGAFPYADWGQSNMEDNIGSGFQSMEDGPAGGSEQLNQDFSDADLRWAS